MNTGELIDHTRTILHDRKAPFMWSTATIVRYLNEGQKRLARATHYFVARDVELDLSAGEASYKLDESVLAVNKVVLSQDGDELPLANESILLHSDAEGRPFTYTLDSETHTLRVAPTPDTDYTLLLNTVSLPADLSENRLTEECEIPDMYQMALCDWVAYRCFIHEDPDGKNDNASAKALARFTESANALKADVYRMRFGNSPQARGIIF